SGSLGPIPGLLWTSGRHKRVTFAAMHIPMPHQECGIAGRVNCRCIIRRGEAQGLFLSFYGRPDSAEAAPRKGSASTLLDLERATLVLEVHDVCQDGRLHYYSAKSIRSFDCTYTDAVNRHPCAFIDAA